VNLPRRDKMAQPRYQELPAVRIPAAQAAGGAVQVKVIAGEALGVRAAIGTHTPILYLHFTLAPGAAHVQEVPREYNAFAYVIEGAAGFGGDAPQAPGGSLVTFARNGDAVELRNTGNAVLDLLLVAGVPLGEPVARYGPFVMNTREELHQAVEDFRSGRMGTIRH
jgi:redox-sensitive bicupin YhaK (pirin superfamily)